MVTECPICKLPRFHGVAGYAGPQCKCQFATLPQMHDKLRADFDAQAAELADAIHLLQQCEIVLTEQHFTPSGDVLNTEQCDRDAVRKQVEAWLEKRNGN